MNASKYYVHYFFVLLLVVSGNALSQELPEEVYNFVQLLIREEPPTLAEANSFHEDVYEDMENNFIYNECWKKDRNIYSEWCGDLFEKLLGSPEKFESYELGWIRERFATVGQSYTLNSIIRNEYNYGWREKGTNNYFIPTTVEKIDDEIEIDDEIGEIWVYYLFNFTIGKHDFAIHYDPSRYLAGRGTEVWSIDGIGEIKYLVEEQGLGWLFYPTEEDKQRLEETLELIQQ